MIDDKQLERRRRANARRLPEDYLGCRLLAHSYTRTDEVLPDPPPFGVRVVLECSRCGTIRIDLIQRQTGGLLSRRYLPAEDYRLPSIDGERPVNADALRFELVRRIDEGF